jgi:hypothetical protein
MEVLSPYAISTDCWDTALSNGKPVFIVGNDDEHNIFSKNSVARMCTCINAASINQKSVLNALKTGRSYGVVLGNCTNAPPVLNFLKLAGDTISLQMSEPARQISFIGQNGKLLETNNNSSTAFYLIKPKDHYIRAVIDYPFGMRILLNPVFRYNKGGTSMTALRVNVGATNIKRVIGLLVFVVWIRIALSFVFSKRSRREPEAESLVFQ